MSSFACVTCALTVSCDSCKVFLKKRPTWTLEAARRKDLQTVMSVCQITYLAKHMLALQNHTLQTRSLQTRQNGLSYSAHQSCSHQRNERDVICTQQKAS